MLGRLRMTTEECINAYVSMFDKIFTKKSHRVNSRLGLQGRFDSQELEKAIKQVLIDRNLDSEALLKDVADAPCKVYEHQLMAPC